MTSRNFCARSKTRLFAVPCRQGERLFGAVALGLRLARLVLRDLPLPAGSRREQQRGNEPDAGPACRSPVGERQRFGIAQAALLLLALPPSPRPGGNGGRSDEFAHRRRQVRAEPFDEVLRAIQQRRRNIEMARFVGLSRLQPFAHDGLECVANANEVAGFRDDRHGLRPDAQQGLVHRPNALGNTIPLGRQQALVHEGLDQRLAGGPACFERLAVESGDDRDRLRRSLDRPTRR